MSNYNSFGVSVSDVTDLYPNVNATDMGGTSVIQAAIDRAVRRIASLLPNDVNEILNNRVTREQLAGPAFGDGTEGPTFQLGLGPIAAADVTKLLIYRVFSDKGKPPCPQDSNQSGALGGTGNQTLTLTGASTTLSENEWLFVTYVIDPTDPTFSLDSYGDYVVMSAGFELGSKLFDQETDSWVLVDKYGELATQYLESLQAGGFVDDTIRAMEFCDEIEPAGAGIMSIRRPRA